ncbi:MAG: hypothetical protein NTV98_01005 [Candidatus Roizmanbacteria bacterium]|nr:hypothetical protein [Candidatus Roizmanbacteria bacterium]
MKQWKIKTIFPLLLLLSFPTAFFFGVVYTEGLFFMFFILSLYFLEKKRYGYAGLFAALSSATRLIGIFLIIPFFFSLLKEHKITFTYLFTTIKKHLFLLCSPLIGLITYMYYLLITTHDPLFFFHSQPIFGANRSTKLIVLPQVYYRYIRIALTATHDFRWYISLGEMTIFTLVFVVLIFDLVYVIKQVLRAQTKNYYLLGLNIFSFANLVLPTLTGTFSSIPRYSLFSLSFFLYLGQMKFFKLKIGVFLLFITLQIILLSLFIQGYFIG